VTDSRTAWSRVARARRTSGRAGTDGPPAAARIRMTAPRSTELVAAKWGRAADLSACVQRSVPERASPNVGEGRPVRRIGGAPCRAHPVRFSRAPLVAWGPVSTTVRSRANFKSMGSAALDGCSRGHCHSVGSRHVRPAPASPGPALLGDRRTTRAGGLVRPARSAGVAPSR
jgi:hypothetical protein